MASRLEELQQAVNPRTGLVPMVILQAMTPYAEKQVAGFPPEVALQYEQAGAAEVYGGGEDGEAPNVTGPRAGSFAPAPVPGPQAAFGNTPAAIRSTAYDLRPEVTPRAQSVAAALPGDGSPVEPARLPDGWREFNAVRLREVAANLSGRNFVELSQDEALEIIQAAEAGKRVGRGDFGIEGDPRAEAHVAGGDEATAESFRADLDARTDQPEVEVRPRGRPRKTEE